MATIEKRGDVWRARIRRNGSPDLSRTFDTEHDAKVWAEETEAAVRAGRLQEHQQRTTTLGELLLAYEQAKSRWKKGAVAEVCRIKALRRDRIAGFSLENLSRSCFRDYRDRRLKTGVTGSTVNRELALLSVTLKWAKAERDAPTDPGMLVGLKVAENAARERRLQPGEWELLQQHAPAWLKAYLVLAVESAMRRGEIADLTWDRVDLQRRVATLLTAKNGHGRRVPLSSIAVRALEMLPRPIVGGRVFDIHRDNITQAFMATCKAAGIEGLRLHDLRGEAVSRLFEKGLDMNSVKAISGHRSSIFIRYMRSGDAEALAQRLG